MQKIIAISGKKGSGKSTLAKAVLEAYPKAKLYSFASEFKKVAVDILGLPEENVYGDDNAKNFITEYTWEKMPFYSGIYQDKQMKFMELDKMNNYGAISDSSYLAEYAKIQSYKSGNMTVREILQCLGTEIFRSMDDDIWVKTLLRRIKKEGHEVAIIDDGRFVNEINSVLGFSNDSVAIRLTRKINTNDSHISETALDNYTGFSYILDNANMTLEQSINDLIKFLEKKYAS